MGITAAPHAQETGGGGSLRRPLLVAMIASLSASALMGILALLSGEFGHLELRILLTTTASGFFSLTALASSVRIDRRHAVSLGALGIAVSAVGLALALIGIWGEPDDESFYRFFGTVAVVASASAYASLALLIRPRHQAVRAVLAGTLGTLAATAAMVIGLILGVEIESEGYFRVLGSLAILTVFGTIVSPLLNRVMERT